MKKIFPVLLSVFLLTSFFIEATMLEQVETAFKTGNSKELSKYFNNTIELSVSGKEEVYSKAQAEQIIKDFFSKNVPKSFKFMHQGNSKNGMQYAIGTLATSGGNFRVSVFVKSEKNSQLIQQIRIDKEE
jgi:hypothetical protein